MTEPLRVGEPEKALQKAHDLKSCRSYLDGRSRRGAGDEPQGITSGLGHSVEFIAKVNGGVARRGVSARGQTPRAASAGLTSPGVDPPDLPDFVFTRRTMGAVHGGNSSARM